MLGCGLPQPAGKRFAAERKEARAASTVDESRIRRQDRTRSDQTSALARLARAQALHAISGCRMSLLSPKLTFHFVESDSVVKHPGNQCAARTLTARERASCEFLRGRAERVLLLAAGAAVMVVGKMAREALC
eukprot:6189836-Pleurochrysis_carterae.AAC.1